LEFVRDEFEHRSTRKIGDRKDRLENRIKPLIGTAAFGLVNHEELIIGSLLNLDEVRHFRDFWNFTKKLAYAPATIKGKGLSHRRSLSICIRACNRRRPLASRLRQ